MTKTKKTSKRVLYVAVVANGQTVHSLRSHGDWASFIGYDRGEVVARALKANSEWGGKYVVLVGTVQHQARVPVKYELVKAKELR